MEALTDRQMEILRYVARTTVESGFPPTIREIGKEFGISSTNGVNDHLKALEGKGYLSRGQQKSRTLVPTPSARVLLGMSGLKQDRTVKVPVLGRVAAGLPLLAQENLDDSLQIDSSLLPSAGKDVFALKVKGESMIGDGILDGDLVFVRRQANARSGEMVVALIEDEATVKRIYPESDRIRLQPSNPSMKPIYIQRSAHRQISILGVVVGVLRRL
jgi:repressor LexA